MSRSLSTGLCFAAALAVSAASQPAAAALNLYYDFDAPAGPGQVANSGVLGGTGTINGGVSVGFPGVGSAPGFSGNSGATFDGNNATPTQIDSGFTAATAGGTNYTASAWIAPASITGDNMVFGQGSGNALHLGLRGDRVHFGHWGADSQSNATVAADNTWRHVTWQYEDGLQRIFINGQLDNSEQQGALANNANVLIGRSLNDGAFEGSLDDVMIYNEALSFNQIAHLAAGGNPNALPAPTADPTTGPLVLNPENGKYYTRSLDERPWIDAKNAAAMESAAGSPGHLAAIGSLGENFVVQNIGTGWIGFTDDPAQAPGAVEGNFQWITGEPVAFQNWGAGEPNNAGGTEHYAEIVGGGAWNDLQNAGNGPRHGLIEFDNVPLGGTFDVRVVTALVTSTADQINNVSQALELLDGTRASISDVTAKRYAVNFLDTAAGGNFNGDALFPGDMSTTDDDNDFVMLATAMIFIPSDGDYTFGTNADDGTQLIIDGMILGNDDVLSGPHNSLRQVFLTEGVHELSLLFFERGGGAEVELFAAAGLHSSFNSEFRLVGDVLNGGIGVAALIPEPATATLGLLAISCLAMRRRRAA